MAQAEDRGSHPTTRGAMAFAQPFVAAWHGSASSDAADPAFWRRCRPAPVRGQHPPKTPGRMLRSVAMEKRTRVQKRERACDNHTEIEAARRPAARLAQPEADPWRDATGRSPAENPVQSAAKPGDR